MRTLFRWVGRAAIVLLIIIAVSAVISWFNLPGEPPSPDKALWAIQTYSNDDMRIPSRVYYAAKLDFKTDGTPVITDYWSYDGKDFHKQRGSKDFPITLYGNIDIKRRTP